MPTPDRVAAFINRNNAILEEIEDLLDEATNQTLRRVERHRARGTAGHLACRGLRRLLAADHELWIPLLDQQLKVRWDSNHVAHILRADTLEMAPPRATVSPELLRLFRHPQPDAAADRINQTNRWLEQIVRKPPVDPHRYIEQAKKSVDGLRVETCGLVNGKVAPEQFYRVVSAAAGAMAMGSLGAAGAEVQRLAWNVTPDALRLAADLFQGLGHTLESLPLLGLVAIAGVPSAGWWSESAARPPAGSGPASPMSTLAGPAARPSDSPAAAHTELGAPLPGPVPNHSPSGQVPADAASSRPVPPFPMPSGAGAPPSTPSTESPSRRRPGDDPTRSPAEDF